MATKQFDFKEFAKNWTAPIVARSQVKEFSGGLLHPRTMAIHSYLIHFRAI